MQTGLDEEIMVKAVAIMEQPLKHCFKGAIPNTGKIIKIALKSHTDHMSSSFHECCYSNNFAHLSGRYNMHLTVQVIMIYN